MGLFLFTQLYGLNLFSVLLHAIPARGTAFRSNQWCNCLSSKNT